jgi:predicted ATPase/DNA-binding XRE family transcriptional regulator
VDNAFSQQVLAMRLAAGLTQEVLAERSGLSVRTIGDLERGRRPVPYPATARVIADALELVGEQRERLLEALIRERRIRDERSLTTYTPAPVDDEPAILGRDDEIAAIERRFAAGDRLLTLVGPGGIGKSRLSRAVAAGRKVAGRRVVVAPLEAITSPDLVLPAIARAAGPPGRGPKPSFSRIARALGAGNSLLILDNFEHLLDAAPIVAELLDEAPALTILITSREALRVRYERILTVAPLPLPAPDADAIDLAANPAVALFLRSLAAAAPGRAPRHDDEHLAAAIVRRLDGLPLAIELAAAQSTVLPLPAVADLLDSAGLAALSSGRRDHPSRFATMDAAIAWSSDLLPPDAQRLFRLLGAFRGGFTTESVFGVAADVGAPALVAALPLLAESHLIEPDPADPAARMRMLEPIRFFAQARLRAAGEEPAVCRAHAAWFLRWAREQALAVAGPEPVPALDALDADLPNLQAAFAHAAAAAALATAASLSQYWEVRNRFREGRAILAAAIAASSAGDGAPNTGALMDAVYWSGCLAYLQSDLAPLEEAGERLRMLAAADGTPEYVARATILEVLRRDVAGLPSLESVLLAREAYALVKDGPKEVSWHMSMVILANLLVQNGDTEAALPLLRAYAEWAETRNSAVHANVAGDWLGFALLETGDAAEARGHFAQSITWSGNAGFTGTVYLPLMGYILAISGEGAPPEDLDLAAILLGALDEDTARHGYPLGERNLAALAGSRERMAAALGDGAFAALLARGHALPLEAALELVIA